MHVGVAPEDPLWEALIHEGLIGEGLGEGGATRALVLVLHLSTADAGKGGAGETRGTAFFLHTLAHGQTPERNGGRGGLTDLVDGAAQIDLPRVAGEDLGDGCVHIGSGQAVGPFQCGQIGGLVGVATYIDQAGVDNGIAGVSGNAVSAKYSRL